MRVLVLNGPNLGRLGRRQPEIYGRTSHDELVELCRKWGRELGLEVEVRQTNHEGQLLDWLNDAADDEVPVVLNAAAWTHYSYAVHDACAQLVAPLVEVHISDPAQRPEQFRHTSVVTPHAVAVIAGHGVDGYRMALAPRSRAARLGGGRHRRDPAGSAGAHPDSPTKKADPRAWQRRTTSRTAWCSTSTASSGRSSGSSTTSPARAARSCARS